MPQVPQLQSAVSADIRPQASASQRNEGADGFSQLLNTVGNDTQADAPQSRDTDAVKARPARNDRADRTDRRDDSDLAAKRDSKTDASDTDSSDKVPAKGKSKDDSSADADGKSSDHKKSDKDNTDASSDVATGSAPAPDKVANTDGNGAVEVAVVSAPVVANNTASEAAAPTGDSTPAIDAAATQSAGANASAAAAQTGIAAQAALNAGKPASTKGQPETVPQTAVEGEGDTDTAATDDGKKTSENKPVQTGINAAFNVAMKAASGAASPSNQQAEAKQISAGEPSFATNIAAKADLKPDASGAAAGHESLENSLAKQLSADLHLGSTGQIVLPDATRGMQINPPPVNLQAQAAVMTATNQPVPLASAALAIEIASRSKDGSRQFDIRLDPPELGRIDVKLDVDKDGLVNTRLTVDRPETLNLLQRDAHGLERALQQAGLKTSDGGLEFSLRQQTPDGSMNQHNQAQQNGRDTIPGIGEIEQTATLHAEQYQWAARMRGGVDIQV